MVPNEMKALLRRSLALWNDGGMKVADGRVELICLINGRPVNPDEIKRYVGALVAAFPDMHYTIEDMVAEDDRIAIRITMRGTHRGDFVSPMGRLTPTDRAVTYTRMEWLRIARGKIAEIWLSWDHLSLLQQFGVLPDPAGATG